MKICVYGASAIGGHLAVELALAGYEVCAIARGAHLDAIQRDGLRLQIDGKEKTARIPASEEPGDFGPQDAVICALKAHQSWSECERFAPLLGPDTSILTAVNGIPWWYFYKTGGHLEGRHLESVDRGGRQWKALGPERAIGCVVDPACEVASPELIVHHEFKRFTIGEPDGSPSPRVQTLARTLSTAGFDAPVRDNIRWNVWLKLWGNACFNPLLSAPPGTTKAMVALGDRIFHGQVGGATCTGCHGADAKGTPLGPNLTGPHWLWGDGSYASIARTITTGVPQPKNYRSPMPPMGGAQLSSDQVSALAAYIWALSHRSAAGSQSGAE